MPLRQLLRRCWRPRSIDTRRSFGSTGRVKKGGLLPGQQIAFHTPCLGSVAPLERTIQRYAIVSCRWKGADDVIEGDGLRPRDEAMLERSYCVSRRRYLESILVLHVREKRKSLLSIPSTGSQESFLTYR